ncbi:MAG: deoxyribonuclease IV [Phycisphaerales bacterium]|nr:MAG: deoxyribonuclease IV [Phycisphaerales bacterium]
MFGSHLSIAGGMVNALLEAEALGLETVQVFTKNQQQWKAPPLKPADQEAWLGKLRELGWEDRTVSHASYLINLASPNDELWAKSIDLMVVELERCEALSIPFLVHHPGAFTSSDAEAGLGRIAAAYKELFKRTKGFRVVSCLEDTVGSGSNLGRTFEELADLRGRIIEATGEAGRVGFCLDTCHMHAGGYDLSTKAGGDAALADFDRLCGVSNVRVMHLNDSVAGAGSRKDRHAHIGEGTIGQGTAHATLAGTGFASVCQHPAFREIPKIMETPKGQTEAGTAFDTLNLRRLRKLGA